MRKIKLILFFYSILLLGCFGEKPKKGDFVGYWVGSKWGKGNSNDTIKINGDGTFIGKHLPLYYLWDRKMLQHPNDTIVTLFDGYGKWDFYNTKNEGWKFELYFDSTSISDDPRLIIQMDVRSEKSFFDNKPPWYLYRWTEDSSGYSYEFHKKKNK